MPPTRHGPVPLRRPIQPTHRLDHRAHTPHIARGPERRRFGRRPAGVEAGQLAGEQLDEVAAAEVAEDDARVALLGGLQEDVARRDVPVDDGVPLRVAGPAAYGVCDAVLHVADRVREVLEGAPDEGFADAAVLLFVLLEDVVQGAQVADIGVEARFRTRAGAFVDEGVHVLVDVGVFAREEEVDFVGGAAVQDVGFFEALLHADAALAGADFVDAGVEVALGDDEGFEDFELVVQAVVGGLWSPERHGDG